MNIFPNENKKGAKEKKDKTLCSRIQIIWLKEFCTYSSYLHHDLIKSLEGHDFLIHVQDSFTILTLAAYSILIASLLILT